MPSKTKNINKAKTITRHANSANAKNINVKVGLDIWQKLGRISKAEDCTMSAIIAQLIFHTPEAVDTVNLSFDVSVEMYREIQDIAKNKGDLDVIHTIGAMLQFAIETYKQSQNEN